MTYDPGYPSCPRCRHDEHFLPCTGAVYPAVGYIPCDDPEPAVPR